MPGLLVSPGHQQQWHWLCKPGLTRGRISTTCVMSVWRNDRNCKYMFLFLLKIFVSAKKRVKLVQWVIMRHHLSASGHLLSASGCRCPKSPDESDTLRQGFFVCNSFIIVKHRTQQHLMCGLTGNVVHLHRPSHGNSMFYASVTSNHGPRTIFITRTISCP